MRRDPTTGEPVVVAPERGGRPRDGICPFCPGREASCAPQVGVVERGGQWAARAVENRYPGLRPTGPTRGFHEVLVESRVHDPLWEQPPTQLEDALALARDRIAHHQRDRRLAHVAWFRNQGPRAGASQAHPHAQLLASSFVPERIETLAARCAAEGDLLGRVLREERAAGERMVRDGEVAAFCAVAPLVPYEVWLVPERPDGDFGALDDAGVAALASAMRAALRAHAAVLDHPDHNVLLFNAPIGGAPGLRWHLRVRPRLVPFGGLEQLGVGMVPVPPEEAAARLRSAG